MLSELRQELLGGRFIFAMTGSAPTSPELRKWVESLLEIHLVDGYGSTEAGMVLFDGEIQRPPVIDYKLVDVPDLGYFATDRPYPRGELLLKTPEHVPRLLQAAGNHRGRLRRRRLLPDRRRLRRDRRPTGWCMSIAATTC